jgi:glycerol kinase
VHIRRDTVTGVNAILALDQGTTSSRALLFDRQGDILAAAQREFRQGYPQPGWVEHDADEIWSTQIEVAAEAIGKVKDVVVDAIGITNQRETTVLWDRVTGRPIANAIVWQDRRTSAFCAELRARGAETLIRKRTGLVLDPYFSATKIRWLLDNVEGARERANAGRLAFGTVDSWLIWNLTGGTVHVTDATNASRTMLFDIHGAAWDREILDLLEIPESLLPTVVPSSERVAVTAPGLSVRAGIPIAGIAGDQQAALFGQRCCRAGMAKSTYGTGSFVVMNSGGNAPISSNGLLSTVAWSRRDQPLEYALEGSIFCTGAAVQWLRDGLRIIESAPLIEPLAASVRDSGGVVFVPAFTGLGAPHWDPYARGAIVGLTRGTTTAHIARAALESIALQTAEVLEAMRADSGIELRELRVDGGGSTNDLLMQIQADLAGIPVVRTAVSETTALGAAYLAGLAVGFWKSDEEIDRQWKADHVFEPRIGDTERRASLGRWRRAVERAKGWAVDEAF